MYVLVRYSLNYALISCVALVSSACERLLYGLIFLNRNDLCLLQKILLQVFDSFLAPSDLLSSLNFEWLNG